MKYQIKELTDQDREALAAECRRLAGLGVHGIRNELYDRGCEGLIQDSIKCPLARALCERLAVRYQVGEDCIFLSEGLYHPSLEVIKLDDFEPLRQFVRLFDEGKFAELESKKED